MKIGIFDPYLDTLGGGEKYILTMAACLAANHEIFVFWNPYFETKIKQKARTRFNLDISNIKFTQNIFERKVAFLARLFNTIRYDVIIYISDGSIPLLFSKKNILIFQFPVNWVNGKNLLTKFKLGKITKIICYSNYVKNFLDKTFLVDSLVLSPPVTYIPSARFKKENIILSVGRFTKAINTKKQETLINIFKIMCKKGLLGWRLIFIGSVLPGDENFIQSLKNKIKGYNMDILVNIPFEKLGEYYQKAKIYWHAAGFGEDLQKYPERAEHFGISTVEAMSAGCVPVVINAGGQKEIVEDGKNGFLWNSLADLQDKTLQLINNDNLWKKLSGQAKERAKFFDTKHFCEELEKIIV